MTPLSFRDILKDNFLRRNNANPRYSLRAFARDLEMEAAQLSRIFKGTQNLSSGKARAIAGRLFESELEREYFVSLVEMVTAKKQKAKDEAQDRVRRLGASRAPNVSAEALPHLSSWVHIAILDLLAIHPLTPRQDGVIAKLLGISALEVRIALESLQKSGFLRVKRGRLEKAEPSLRTSSGTPSATIRNLHKQFIQKAAEAVDNQSVEERHFVGKTFAIAKGDLPKIRALVDELSRKVSEVVAQSKSKNELYQMNVQCFRLLKGENP